jgi:hypothetical protein
VVNSESSNRKLCLIMRREVFNTVLFITSILRCLGSLLLPLLFMWLCRSASVELPSEYTDTCSGVVRVWPDVAVKGFCVGGGVPGAVWVRARIN